MTATNAEQAIKQARQTYQQAKEQAYQAYQQTVEQAWRAHEQAVEQAWDAYEQALQAHGQTYQQAIEQTVRAHGQTYQQAQQGRCDWAMWDHIAVTGNGSWGGSGKTHAADPATAVERYGRTYYRSLCGQLHMQPASRAGAAVDAPVPFSEALDTCKRCNKLASRSHPVGQTP